jgi:AraC-like DNA-binding protein
MNPMKLHIKNMVCNRCIMVVNDELEKLGLHPASVELGEVVLNEGLSDIQKDQVKSALEKVGFELIDNRKSLLIEQVKTLLIELVHRQNNQLNTNLSDYLIQQLGHDYSSISTLFSEVEGTTIEKYYIAQKIERVKELLVYDELSLSEIAHLLNYSSVAHLSKQFKKTTGLTPSHFKQIGALKRKPLDKL